MNGKLRVCRKCLPGQKNEEAFYEDLSRYGELNAQYVIVNLNTIVVKQ